MDKNRLYAIIIKVVALLACWAEIDTASPVRSRESISASPHLFESLARRTRKDPGESFRGNRYDQARGDSINCRVARRRTRGLAKQANLPTNSQGRRRRTDHRARRLLDARTIG